MRRHGSGSTSAGGVAGRERHGGAAGERASPIGEVDGAGGGVPVTVAVKVTLVPALDGLSELESAVVVGAEPVAVQASISVTRA